MIQQPEYLSIDYGLRRVGIAKTSISHHLVIPVSTFELSKNVKNHAFEIATYLLKNKIVPTVALVVGYPISMKNTITAQTELVTKLVDQLKLHLKHTNIVLFDERMSSNQARMAYNQTRKKDKNNLHVIDTLSAMIILRTYIEAHHE